MFTALFRRASLGHWPGICHVCGRWPTQPICGACMARFGRTAAACPRCAAPLSQGLCTGCLASPPPDDGLGRCVAAVDYGYPWEALISAFKFHGQAGWAAPFAALMWRAEGACALVQACDVIAPVPLTPTRLAERGHHAPWELAKAVARQHAGAHSAHSAHSAPVRLCADALVRLSDGAPQHRLGRAERLRNLAGAFAVSPRHAGGLAGRRVLLVDDVTTTGATLLAAARALHAVGVAGVDALVFARTPAPGEAAAR
jgi:ComF family protein